MTEFADHLLDRIGEMENCLVCSSPTKSHAVLIAHDDETGDMVAVEELDDADGFGTVCHGCYEDADGEADRVVALYNERLNEILDAVGVDKQDIADRPDEVAGYEYECGRCGTVVTAEDVPDHRDTHDDVTVSFERADLTDEQ